MQLASISSSTTVQKLVANDFEGLEKSVGVSIKSILDRPPICMLMKVTGELPPELFLARQLHALANMVNVDARLNLQPQQIPTIAGVLMQEFPAESLEDFVLCFRRGSIGVYGQIFRLDAGILCEWMRKYLDEKYTHVERQHEEKKKEGIKQDEVNYEAFRERVSEFLQQDKKGFSSANENEIQRQKLNNPYAYYPVRGVQIYATSQEHAEAIAQRMIDKGELEEY